MSWIKITPASSIPLREGRSVRIGDEEVAVFNLGDRFAAIENRCPHNGGPLCDGIVSGAAVVCPLHGWKVSLETGEILKPQVPVCVEIFPTKVEDGLILIDMPERKLARMRKEQAA